MASSNKPQHPQKTLRRIIGYAVPHKAKILGVFGLTASYSMAITLRLGLIGLLLDGVLLVGFGGNENSIALSAYKKVVHFLGMKTTLARSFRKSDPFTQLEAQGKFVCTADGKEIAAEDIDPETKYVFVALEGTLIKHWVDKPSHEAPDGGQGRRFLRMEVSVPAVRAEKTGPDIWCFTDGEVTYSTGSSLSKDERENYIIIFCIITGILALAIGFFSFSKDYFARKVYLHIAADIRKDIYAYTITQSVNFFDRHKSGDLMSRFLNDTTLLQMFIQNFFNFFLEQPFTIMFSLGLAFYVAPMFTLVSLPFFLLIFYPVIKGGRRVKKHGHGRMKQLGVITEAIHQLFGGIRIIKAFGMEGEENKRFHKKNRDYIRVAMKMEKAKITSRSTLEVLYNLGFAVMVLGVGYLMALDVKSLGNYGMFLGAMVSIYRPLRRITRTYNNLQEALAGAERVFNILDQKSDIIDAPDAVDLTAINQEIIFDHVSFRYLSDEDAPSILKDVSFSAKTGEVIAIVGPSGAGKSTMMDLIARFYEPKEGRILFDGVDIRQITQKSLLRQIAIVGQDPFLFNTTVRENLRYGKREATEQEMAEACRKAFIQEVIEKLPEGYDTEIGDRGAKLSGGERQRLTIARAFLKNAPLLILDEATSSLDSEAEKLVQKAIQNLIQNRLTFMIAHRLSTITAADKILVLENGRIVESGTHEALLAKKNVYWRLYQIQHPDDAAPTE